MLVSRPVESLDETVRRGIRGVPGPVAAILAQQPGIDDERVVGRRERRLRTEAGIHSGTMLGARRRLLPFGKRAYRQLVAPRGTQAALREAEARVGELVESAMDAVITVDEAQRVVQFNAAA